MALLASSCRAEQSRAGQQPPSCQHSHIHIHAHLSHTDHVPTISQVCCVTLHAGNLRSHFLHLQQSSALSPSHPLSCTSLAAVHTRCRACHRVAARTTRPGDLISRLAAIGMWHLIDSGSVAAAASLIGWMLTRSHCSHHDDRLQARQQSWSNLHTSSANESTVRMPLYLKACSICIAWRWLASVSAGLWPLPSLIQTCRL